MATLPKVASFKLPLEELTQVAEQSKAKNEELAASLKAAGVDGIAAAATAADTAVGDFVTHYHHERNHQGRNNGLLFPQAPIRRRDGPNACRSRLGGLLKYYHRPAA